MAEKAAMPRTPRKDDTSLSASRSVNWRLAVAIRLSYAWMIVSGGASTPPSAEARSACSPSSACTMLWTWAGVSLSSPSTSTVAMISRNRVTWVSVIRRWSASGRKSAVPSGASAESWRSFCSSTISCSTGSPMASHRFWFCDTVMISSTLE